MKLGVVVDISEQLTGLCQGFNGRIGLSALDLQTNQTFNYQADEMFPTASVIKLAVLVTLMQQCEAGQRGLEELIMLRRADKTAGSGLLQHLTPGLTLTVRDWAFLMMNISDNTATNVLIDYVGLEQVAAWLAEHGYGEEIQLHHKLNLTAVTADQNHFGTATPAALTRLMAAIFRGEVVSAAAGTEMLRLMDKVGYDRVGRYLPFDLYSDAPEAEKLRLAGKTGSFRGTRGQTAVVWRGSGEQAQGFVLTVLTAGNPEPETWNADAPGVLIIGRLAQVLYAGTGL